jgi:cytochrome c oxidase subunit 4
MSSTVVSKKLLVWIWAALLALLLLTWGLAQLDLHHFNVAAALTIALLKMLLVLLVFMHVKYKPPLTWIFVAAGFIWLLIMVDLSLSDYMSRGSVPRVLDKTWKHDAWPAPTKEEPGPAPRIESP